MIPVRERVARIRAKMVAEGAHDYLVLSSDEHLSEYLPRWRMRRAWASGFTGSAGDLRVGHDDARLYADGRYHLQAETELADSSIALAKLGQPGTKTLSQDIEERARSIPNYVLAFDPFMVPLSAAEALKEAVQRAHGSVLEIPGHLVDPLWTDRPTPQASPLLPVPLAWSGQSTSEKLALLRGDLTRSGAHALVAVKLDQIAWLLNLRSQSDVPFNPVFESFLILEPTACHLFVRDPWTRVPASLRSDLGDVQIHDYDDFARGLSRIQGPVLIDPTGVTAGVVSTLEQQGTKILRALSPIEIRKAVKNSAEQEAMRRANLRASVAKTKALLWLRREHAAGSLVTERRFREVIEAAYREQPEFFDLSFDTIAATGPHGAIIHYGGADETPLEEGHLFLIDSGAHIGGGTTDDTRTVAVGRASAEARRIFTLVLKGHINAARQIIPEGIPGTALDALARAPLWNAGLNYDHGTGHGVGAFLNVHEGPFSLSDRERKPHLGQPLREGIVSSIEPGYYRPGFGGVRLENLYLYVKADLAGATRPFLRLEPLSFIPFDPELTEESLLDPPEKAWLALYHQQCLDKLRPHLKETERYELQALLR